MTRPEITGIRPLDFSKWIRQHLPDSSTGFAVSDLDFIIWNWKTRDVMLIETKTRNAEMKPAQRIMFELLAKWIAKGLDSDWTFHGFHFIKFENTWFHDGFVYLNGEVITEMELQEKLSNFEP